MAEQPAATAELRELTESNLDLVNPATTEDMVLESALNPEAGTNGESNAKRAREEDENDDVLKKQKVGEEEEEKSVEEERLEKKPVEGEGEGDGKDSGSARVSIGPKEFGSSVEMFDYFFSLLHFWPTNLNVNKYEHMVLLDLIKKGHPEPQKKIGGGIKAFQVRYHPMWKSKCFFLIREDDIADDFSFRKYVDFILPLPENMKIKSDANKASGGGGGKGRGGKGWHGRGRGGKSRN